MKFSKFQCKIALKLPKCGSSLTRSDTAQLRSKHWSVTMASVISQRFSDPKLQKCENR